MELLSFQYNVVKYGLDLKPWLYTILLRHGRSQALIRTDKGSAHCCKVLVKEYYYEKNREQAVA